MTLNLSGVWTGDDGAVYRIRHLTDDTIWWTLRLVHMSFIDETMARLAALAALSGSANSSILLVIRTRCFALKTR